VRKTIEAVRARRDEIAKDIPKLQEGLDEAAAVLDDIKNGNAVITRVESKAPATGVPK